MNMALDAAKAIKTITIMAAALVIKAAVALIP